MVGEVIAARVVRVVRPEQAVLALKVALEAQAARRVWAEKAVPEP